MACVLRAGGADFQVESFLLHSPFKPSHIWQKGSPRNRGRVSTMSGLSLVVSNAAIGDFKRQCEDAIGFLRRNSDEIRRLIAFSGLTEAELDFAVSLQPSAASQTDRLPAELVRIAGGLGLALTVSHYARHVEKVPL